MSTKAELETFVVPELENAISPRPYINAEWPDRDVQVLLKYYGRVPNKNLVKVLNRTLSAITSKAARLGITKRFPND